MARHGGDIKVALTRRQKEIALLVAEGLTNRQIAERLYISERTADGHLEQIRNKLGVSSRAQIAAWATTNLGSEGDLPAPAITASASHLPVGTVTYLITDIVGAARLWDARPDSMAEAMRRHDQIVRVAVAARGGHVVESGREGDSILAAFSSARDAVLTALEIQLGIQAEAWPEGGDIRVRAVLHTGEAELREGHYYGPALYRGSRLLGIGHGGQTLVSLPTQQLIYDSLPPPVTLRDLGSHRLRDLSVPERVFQLEHPGLRSHFPALLSPEGELASLPEPLTSFVDRESEIAELEGLQARQRLVTLTGAGGCGKTRLALQVARGLADRYPDGVRLVELAPITDPGLVPASVARSMGLREEAGRLLTETLAQHLAPKRLLLLLDNCEHLIEATAELTKDLLTRCPELKVLATSRQPLEVSGEAVFPVPPLAFPEQDAIFSVERMLESPSVRLFADRAGPAFSAASADAPSLALICRRLDGIPLAIELAASRVSVLPVPDIAKRLDSRFQLLTGGGRSLPARHRTLEAAIDWSHELLNAEESTLFRRVSVFAGHFDLEAAEAVGADESLPRGRVLDVLSGLVAKSLVIAKEGRYRLLDTIREFARGRLGAAGERDACLRRLTEHLLAMATNESRQGGRDSLDLLELELYNARPALEWCEAVDPELGLRLAAALYDVLVARGHVSEARQWFERLLSRSDSGSDASSRAHLLAGLLAYSSADAAEAQAHLDVYLAAMRGGADRQGLADGLTLAGHLASFRGELEIARSSFEEVLAIRRELDDKRGEAHALHNLGVAHAVAGDVASAVELFSRSLEFRTAIGNRDEGLVTMTFLGAQQYLQGDQAGGWRLLLEAIDIEQRRGDRRAAWTLDTLAMMAARESDAARALQLAGAAQAMHAASGTVPSPNWRNLIDPALASARRELGPAASEVAWAKGEAMDFDEALEYARSAAPAIDSHR